MRIIQGDEPPRDQGLSVFSPILLRLCRASDALGAALVDGEGETVDYAGRIDPYDLRVAAAEFRLVLSVLQAASTNRSGSRPSVRELMVRARGRSFALWALSEGYALVVVLPRHAFRFSQRALAQAAEELRGEAGLCPAEKPERPRWSSVEVRTEPGDTKRPQALQDQGAWQPVVIMGRLEADPHAAQETGYLARTASGRELLLVREPLGKWFAGEPL